jgi:multidrug efflux system outer membrane protein
MIIPNRRSLSLILAIMASVLPLWAEGSAAASAGRQLGVDDVVALALGNNASLKQAAITLEAKRRALGLSWNEALPSLTANAGLAQQYETGLIANSLSATGTLSLSLSLSASFGDDMKLARLNYESQLLSYATTRQKVALSVRKSAYNILLDAENLKIAKQNIERESASYAETEAKYKAGLASELDLLTAKVSLETLKPKAETYATTLANDLDSLKSDLGLGTDEEIAITGSLEISGDAIRELLAAAMTKSESDNLSVAAASKALAIASLTSDSLYKSKLLPSLSLSAYAEPSLPIASSGSASSSSVTTSATATLSLPIDNFLPGSSAQQKIAEAKDSVAIDESALKEAIEATKVSRKSDRRSVESYQSTLAVLKLNVDLTQRAYDAAKAAYDKGLETLTELQSAAGDLESAKLNALSKSYDLIAAILELEYETGLPLDTIGRF